MKQQARRIPLSVLRQLVRRARFVARYVQGTMGLEGRAIGPDVVRKMVRDSFREAIAKWRYEQTKDG